MRRTIILIIISFIITVPFTAGSVCALSEDDSIAPVNNVRYQYIESISTTLSISNGTANAGVRVRDTNGDTTKII